MRMTHKEPDRTCQAPVCPYENRAPPPALYTCPCRDDVLAKSVIYHGSAPLCPAHQLCGTRSHSLAPRPISGADFHSRGSRDTVHDARDHSFAPASTIPCLSRKCNVFKLVTALAPVPRDSLGRRDGEICIHGVDSVSSAAGAEDRNNQMGGFHRV
ncbi:unnamed protein product [Ectocarpus sp. 12 AP-2014]